MSSPTLPMLFNYLRASKKKNVLFLLKLFFVFQNLNLVQFKKCTHLRNNQVKSFIFETYFYFYFYWAL